MILIFLGRTKNSIINQRITKRPIDAGVENFFHVSPERNQKLFSYIEKMRTLKKLIYENLPIAWNIATVKLRYNYSSLGLNSCHPKEFVAAQQGMVHFANLRLCPLIMDV